MQERLLLRNKVWKTVRIGIKCSLVFFLFWVMICWHGNQNISALWHFSVNNQWLTDSNLSADFAVCHLLLFPLPPAFASSWLMANISRLHLVTVAFVAVLRVLFCHLNEKKNYIHFPQDSLRVCNATFPQRYGRWARIMFWQLYLPTILSWNRKHLRIRWWWW